MLVRFKDVNEINETEMICACEVDSPAEFLKVVKESEWIRLRHYKNTEKKDWKYNFSRFTPTTNDGLRDVLDIFVEPEEV